MTIHISEVSEALKSKSSISQLPLNLQSKALRILERIKISNLKRKKLKATILRTEARMNTNFFCPLFKWLQVQRYCEVKANTEISKKKRTGVQVKLVEITKSGEVALIKRKTLGNMKNIIKDFNNASSLKQENDLLQDLFIEAFDFAYYEYYYGGKYDAWDQFSRGLEERLRQHLDKEIGDQNELIHEVHLIINGIPRAPILEDAKRAQEKGHFLTRNHIFILNKMEQIEEKELFNHNERWRKNVLLPKLHETNHGFPRQINLGEILKREMKERDTPQLPEQYDLILRRC